MNEKVKSKLKDGILKTIAKNGRTHSVESISKDLKVDVAYIAYLVEELQSDNLVSLENISAKKWEVANNYIVTQTNKGIYFLLEGGNFKRFKRARLAKRWTIIKIIAAIINALALITIGVLSLKNSRSSEQNKEHLKMELQKENKANESSTDNPAVAEEICTTPRKPEIKKELQINVTL